MLTCAERLRHHPLTQIIGPLRPVDGALSSVTISAGCSTLEHYSATITTALTVTIKSRQCNDNVSHGFFLKHKNHNSSSYSLASSIDLFFVNISIILEPSETRSTKYKVLQNELWQILQIPTLQFPQVHLNIDLQILMAITAGSSPAQGQLHDFYWVMSH